MSATAAGGDSVLPNEEPFRGYAKELGGSAGPETRGGQVQRPEEMPTRKECDYVVKTKKQLLKVIGEAEATIYVADDIDVTGAQNVRVGKNVTLVGGRCDPDVTMNGGRGPIIKQDYFHRHLFITRHSLSMYGIVLEGPETKHFDPRDRLRSNSDWNVDKASDWYASGLFVYPPKDEPEVKIVGCEFFGWTFAGVECGSKGNETRIHFDRCFGHHNQMETLGYTIQHYNGIMSVTRCLFDKCRHAIASFGYPTGGYAVAECVFGPGPWYGHAADMHCLANNLSDGDRTAGKYCNFYRCSFYSNWDGADYPQEAVAVRGKPENLSYLDKCDFPNHDELPDPTGDQGSAYRQETEWADNPDEWQNFEPRDNIAGSAFEPGYGAPVAKEEPLSKPVQTLTIQGKGQKQSGEYWVYLDGKSKPTSDVDNNDEVQTVDGETVIHGTIRAGTDSFNLDANAQLTGVWFSTPAVARIDGKHIPELPSLVTTAAEKRFKQK